MELCPNCGQEDSIDPIALASGPLSGLRGERCAACESFWVATSEVDGLGDLDAWGQTARGQAGLLPRGCRACGADLKLLPAVAGVTLCDSCQVLITDEAAYDRLEIEVPEPGENAR